MENSSDSFLDYLRAIPGITPFAFIVLGVLFMILFAFVEQFRVNILKIKRIRLWRGDLETHAPVVPADTNKSSTKTERSAEPVPVGSKPEVESADDYFAKMIDFVIDREFDKAKSQLDAFEKSNPTDREKYNARGFYFYSRYLGSQDKSYLGELDNMEAISESSYWGAYWTGRAKLNLEDYGGAIESFENAAKTALEPKDRAEMIVELAKIDSVQNGQDHAISQLRRAVTGESDPVVLHGLYVGIGELYGDKNRFMEAVSCESALSYDPVDT